MKTSDFKDSWNEQKEQLKKKIVTLTESDLLFAAGKKEEMLGKIQLKLGKTKEELYKIISIP